MTSSWAGGRHSARDCGSHGAGGVRAQCRTRPGGAGVTAGRLARVFSSTAGVSASRYLAEGPLCLMTFALRLLKVLTLLAVWRGILAAHPDPAGLRSDEILTYTLIAGVFGEQLALRTSIDLALWEGTVVTKLLQPVPLPVVMFAEMAGRWIPGTILVGLPLLLLGPALGVATAPTSLSAGAAFAASLGLAIVAGMAIDFLFAALLIRVGGSIWAITGFREVVTAVLSGAMIPLALMPMGVGRLLEWLPFAATASAPLRIFLGAPPAGLLALQGAWCVVLWLGSAGAWRAVRERVAGYGG